jgi:hypothetical protein
MKLVVGEYCFTPFGDGRVGGKAFSDFIASSVSGGAANNEQKLLSENHGHLKCSVFAYLCRQFWGVLILIRVNRVGQGKTH